MSKNKKKNFDFKMTDETDVARPDNNFFFGEAPEKKDIGALAEEAKSDAALGAEVTGKAEKLDAVSDNPKSNKGEKAEGVAEQGKKLEASEKSSEKNDIKTQPEKSKITKDRKEPKKREKVNFAYFLTIAGVLTLICAAVALMLGFVNFVTKDVIADKEENARKAAVYEIFPEAEDVIGVEGEEQLFIVKENGILSGYCISTVTAGYGGDINLIVGVTKNGEVKGVKIVSMSETAGLGSKTQSSSFLEQFIGKSGTLTVGENVDGVSGATISSKAVTAGVEKAVNYPVDINAIAAQLGIPTEQKLPENEESETEEAKPETEITTDSSIFAPNNPEQPHIDASLVGANQNDRYYEKDNSYTATKETTGSYLEKETTDTDTDTQSDDSGTT